MGRRKKSEEEGPVYQVQLPEIRITGVPEDIKAQVVNISDHIGVSVSSLLKPKLREWINSFPEHYKLPILEKRKD